MRKIEWHYIEKSYKLYFMVDLNIEPYGGTNAAPLIVYDLAKINKHCNQDHKIKQYCTKSDGFNVSCNLIC